MGISVTGAVLEALDLPSKRSDGEDRKSAFLQFFIAANPRLGDGVTKFLWSSLAVTILKCIVISEVFVSSAVLFYDYRLIS